MKTVRLFALFIILPAAAGALPQDDIVFKAMKDEMARTLAKLQMEGMNKPYFVAYNSVNATGWEISATFGALLKDDMARKNEVWAELRVGGPEFDNRNFAAGYYGNRPEGDTASFEDNYDNIRFNLWDATDGAYKQVLEKLAQKKAFKEKKGITDKLPDFAPVEPKETIGDVKIETLDRAQWAATARRLSAVFKDYPEIQKGVVEVKFENSVKRYLNSEGSAVRVSGAAAEIDFAARAQAADGFKIEREKKFVYASLKDIPSEKELEAKLRDFAGAVTAAARSGEGSVYIGPVIFEGEASAKFFDHFLAENVSRPREILADDDDPAKRWRDDDGSRTQPGEFYNRLGLRVMAPFMSAVDDPGLKEYNGTALYGHYLADDEGVPGRKVQLVRKGKLAGLLMSRAPIKEIAASNGHGRGGRSVFPEGAPGSLIITAEKTKTASKAGLKNKMLALCRELELDYGVIIRDIDRFSAHFAAYKVYAKDGREEPMRGLEFGGLTTRALRDIAAASDEMFVYNYERNGVPTSIVAPSVLVQEAEIKKTDTKPERLPYLANPYFEKRQP